MDACPNCGTPLSPDSECCLQCEGPNSIVGDAFFAPLVNFPAYRADELAALIGDLEQEERALSDRRLLLQAAIDAIRAELASRPPCGTLILRGRLLLSAYNQSSIDAGAGCVYREREPPTVAPKRGRWGLRDSQGSVPAHDRRPRL